MPATFEDRQKAETRAKTLSAEGGQFEAGAFSLGPQVMEAVRADRQQRGVSQLATDVGNTLGQIPTDSAAIRQRAGDVVNPLQTDVFTAAQRGQNLNTLGTIAQQSEYNQGTITDILSEESNKFRAMAAAKMAEAQQAQNEANSIFERLQFEEQTRQFNESLAEKQRQFNERDSGSGGGSIAEMLKLLGIGVDKDGGVGAGGFNKSAFDEVMAQRDLVDFDEAPEESFDIFGGLKEALSGNAGSAFGINLTPRKRKEDGKN